MGNLRSASVMACVLAWGAGCGGVAKHPRTASDEPRANTPAPHATQAELSALLTPPETRPAHGEATPVAYQPAAAPAPLPAAAPVATPALYLQPPSAEVAAPSSPALIAGAPQPTAYAFIVGIEQYRDVPAAIGAKGDAERFAEVVRKTLGVPAGHVRVALDARAGKSDIEKGFNWLNSNAGAGSRIYFYFSGHGAPEPSNGSAFLVPYDGDPQDLESTALPMAGLLERLGQTKAREVIAFVDSCFSGATGSRSVLRKDARPLVAVKDAPAVDKVALLSAASGDEISGAMHARDAGAFTTFVTEGLGTGKADLDGDGQVSMQELSDFVRPRVKREAKLTNREQNPKLTLGAAAGEANNLIVGWGLGQ